MKEFYDPKIREALEAEKDQNLNVTISGGDGKKYQISNNKQLIREFLLLLSTCHDCMVNISKEDKNVLNYEGPSPDEVCLVSAARQQDYIFLGNTSGSVVIEGMGKKLGIAQGLHV